MLIKPPATTAKARGITNREAADVGNELFKQGKFAEANLAYTEALKTHGEYSNLFVNRSLCMLVLGDWNEAIADAKRAIDIDKHSVKGHFFLGLGYLEEGNSEDAINHLKEAKCLSEKSNILYTDNPIESAIRSAYYLRWKDRNRDIVQQQHDEEEEVPEYFSCQICMDLLQDPVITRLGITYCRRCITEIIYKVGHADPITGAKVDERDLIPNIALRNAIEKYVEDHGWVFAGYD